MDSLAQMVTESVEINTLLVLLPAEELKIVHINFLVVFLQPATLFVRKIRKLDKSGTYWARTSDLCSVKAAL